MDAFLTGIKKKTESKKIDIRSNKHTPWVEKYRPKTLDDIAHQSEVVSVLRKCVDGADIPNLLFYGPPGTGKTSLILALARQIFGPLYSSRVLELNASDERGIDVIREKVKAFAHIAVAKETEQSSSSTKRPPPPFKLIVLDEADSMTVPAQAALRRIMETESRTTRFCLTCNYVTRIIDPITSRCSKFRFQPLDNEVSRNRLRYIADAEQIEVGDKTLDRLLQLSQGDLRQAITMMQSSTYLQAIGETSSTIQLDQIDQVFAVIPDALLNRLLQAARNGSFDDLQQGVKDLLLEGHSAGQAILQLHDLLLEMEEISESCKATLFEALSLADSRLVEGADEYLQLLYVGGTLLEALA